MSFVTARHRWRLFARVEALVRGSENSLRRRAETQLPGRVKQTSLWQDLYRAGSRFAATPFGLPVGLLALVALLAFWGGSLPWSPAVLADLGAARRVLGLLWQTQATALALTVAVALFAFESLVRQRQSAGLRDYAVRTGLQQFLMLGVAGLLCLGTVLVWTPARLPPAAATAALGIAAAWFLALPLFLRRSFTVVGPEWFRAKRLQDVNEAVHRHVELEATSLVGRAILAEQVEGVEAGPTASLGWAGRTLEVAGRPGELYDVHLGRLQQLSSTSSGQIAILRHLGGRLADDAVLLATNTTAGPASNKPVCTVVRQPPDDELARQITALHEEALEAIRVGSPGAAEEVATAYVELLLAWPRAWRQLDQTVEGGLLDAWGPFTLTPLDEVRVNLIFQLEQAVAAGLREHVFAITAIPRRVAREALDLQATDLVQKTNSMLVGFVSPGTEHTQELRKVAAEQAQMHQVELCDFYVTQGLEQAATATTGQPVTYWEKVANTYFYSIVEMLLALYRANFPQQFWALDARFAEMLRHWRPQPPGEGTAIRRTEARTEEERARHEASPSDVKDQLECTRLKLRLTVLAWLLRAAPADTAAAGFDPVAYARRLGELRDLMAVVEAALEADGPLWRWLVMEQRESEAEYADVEGHVLKALALVVLANEGSLSAITAQAWLNETRISRILAALEELGDDAWVREQTNLDEGEVEEFAEGLREKLQAAEQEQRERERQALIAAPLDESRVAAFRSAVVSEWREKRRVPNILALGQARTETADSRALSGENWRVWTDRLGKKLFLESFPAEETARIGRRYGDLVALKEAQEIVRVFACEANPISVEGEAQERARELVGRMRDEGYEPTLMIVSGSWRLSQALGLSWETGHDVPVDLAYFDQMPVIRIPGGVEQDGAVVAVDLPRFCLVRRASREEDEFDVSVMDRSGEQQLGESIQESATDVEVQLKVCLGVGIQEPEAARTTVVLPTADG